MDQGQARVSHVGFGGDDGQYLTFTLGHEEYGVEILKVQEIKGSSVITPIPNTPAYIKGVTNLRGTIIPVVDLRAKLQMPEAPAGRFAATVVLTVGAKTVGLLVDAVSDVLHIPKADVQPTPDFGAEVDARFINGVARAGDKLIILLDIERVLAGDEAPLAAAS
jgi:purine-binding chemotaxis protein CheW